METTFLADAQLAERTFASKHEAFAAGFHLGQNNAVPPVTE